MPGLLLDTNVLIALLNKEVDRLPGTLRLAIANGTIELVVSAASLWEIAIKTRLGKLKVGAALDTLPDLLEALGLELLAIAPTHAVAAAEADPPTRDPFDRLLLAQCHVEGLLLATLDRALVEHRLAWHAPAAP